MPDVGHPQVTVHDPRRTDQPADLLGDDCPPWRPSSRLLLLAGIAGLLALAVPALLHRRPPPAARLAVISGLEAQLDGELLLGLRDDDTVRVRVLRVRLDGEGFSWQPVDASLAARQATDVHLPVTPRCPPGDPPLLLVDVVAGGHQRQVRLPLGADRGQQLLAAVQRACGSYPLGTALRISAPRATGSSLSSTGSGTEAVLQLDLENRTTQPVTLLGIDAGRGFNVQLDLPLPLTLRGHPAPYELGTDRTRVVVRVRVVDCRLLRGRGRQPEAPADGQLLFTVGRGGETAVVAPNGQPQLQNLARTCG